jgi:hypothetical protein
METMKELQTEQQDFVAYTKKQMRIWETRHENFMQQLQQDAHGRSLINEMLQILISFWPQGAPLPETDRLAKGGVLSISPECQWLDDGKTKR